VPAEVAAADCPPTGQPHAARRCAGPAARGTLRGRACQARCRLTRYQGLASAQQGSCGQRQGVRRTQGLQLCRGAAGEQRFDGRALRRAAGRAARAAGFGFDAAALLRGVYRVEPGGPGAPDDFRELAT